jgi:uncharacterized protein YndB with AHSA1/START domain
MEKNQFVKDLPNKKITVTRFFNAAVEEVWRAWTESELLDQWWAPKPWKAETKRMDFREGGSWLYAMVGPNDERHWAKAEYKSITKNKAFEGADMFTDENGNRNPEMPGMYWKVQFIPEGSGTMVQVNISFETEEDMKKIIQMGFEEGLLSAMNNLDELLVSV